jgi:tellurite resistance protein TerC
MAESWLPWIAFNVFVPLLLALDLGLFHRKAHVISFREAIGWSIFWLVLALAFAVGVYYWMSLDSSIQFLTGYLIEKSLSVDNIFAFALIFSYFNVPAR